MIAIMILFLVLVLFLGEQQARKCRYDQLRIRDTHGESSDNSPPRD